MFYGKEFTAAKTAVKKARYTRFAAQGSGGAGVLAATGGQNCEFSDGRLLPATLGLADYKTDTGILLAVPNPVEDPPARFAVLPYTEGDGAYGEAVMLVSGLGMAYIGNESVRGFVSAGKFFGHLPATAVFYDENERAKLIFCGEDGVFSYDKTEKFKTLYAGKASPFVKVFHERLFFAEAPFTVRYCAPLAPGDWTDGADEGGHVAFPAAEGEIVGLEALEEELYVFQKKGIVRLNARGAARDFSAGRVAYGGGKIYPGSIGVCGKKIFFLAEDGLYSFDGESAAKTGGNLPIEPMIGGQGCEHGAFGGKYFLRYPAREGGMKLLVWDEASKSGYFSFTGAAALSQTERGTLWFSDGKLKETAAEGALPDGEIYLFEAAGLDFGESGRKLLRKFVLQGRGSCVLEIESETEIRRFPVTFARGRTEVRPLLRGSAFDLRLRLEKNCQVWGLEAEYALPAQRRSR